MTALAAVGCARCGGALEVGDLRCPLCGLTAPGSRVPGAPREKVHARVARCDTCGAAVEYSAEAKAPRCAFCASVMHVEVMADPLEQAEAIVPFEVDAAAARAALGRFLAQERFFRPSDLAALAAVDSFQPLWWPAWGFSAGARVSWAADSNAGHQRSDWAPHAGQVELSFQDVLVSASRGLSEGECARLAEGYRLNAAGSEPRGPEDAQMERFDVTRSGARRQIQTAVEHEARQRMEREHIPGVRFRNVHVAVVLSRLETRRYALPAYVLAYRYREKLYRVVVHGQDPAVVLGEAPVSWARVLLVVVWVLVAIGLLGILLLR